MERQSSQEARAGLAAEQDQSWRRATKLLHLAKHQRKGHLDPLGYQSEAHRWARRWEVQVRMHPEEDLMAPGSLREVGGHCYHQPVNPTEGRLKVKHQRRTEREWLEGY